MSALSVLLLLWFVVDDSWLVVFGLFLLNSVVAGLLISQGGWLILVAPARLVMIVWNVGLSLSDLVVVEVTLNSELVSVGLKSDGVDCCSIWVLIIGEGWWIIHDWDEVLVDWWLIRSDLGSRVWVEVTVVKIDLVNIVIQVVSVVASV